MDDKTTPQPTMKHHLITASISAGIVLGVLALLWFTFKVIPAVFSNGSNFVATSLSSTFIPDDKKATTTEKKTETKTDTTKTETTEKKPVYIAPSYYGNPDLEVRLIATGVIDPATKRFIETSYSGSADSAAIKFEVKNVGTNVSGAWNLRLNMPSRTTPLYDSGLQMSIKPGDRIQYVVSFEFPTAQGTNMAYITADPFNAVPEISEGNNSLTVPLRIEGTTYNYNYNYNYGSNNGYGTQYTWTNINANCYANPASTYPGNAVNWYVTATGGNGYYSYSWSGTDDLFGTTNAVNKTYFTSGTKFASVVVTSNGQSITKVCSMQVF